MFEKKVRILHVLVSNSYSGAENVVCQIISMFKDNENVEMIYCSPDGKIRKALEERKIKYALIKEPSLKEIKRVINEVRPDLIHAHDMRASFLTAITAKKIPFISHIHNNNFNSRGFNFKSLFYLYSAIKAKHVFWVSKSSFEGYCFGNLLKNKSTVLYNVIDRDEIERKAETALEKEGYDIVYLGRLTVQKNPKRLIDVLKIVVSNKKDVSICIIGTGELEREVCQKIEEENLKNNINYLGFMSNPYGILKNSKIMIMTSLWEGTPMCALEAMSLGVPIVSTPTDGLCELIDKGKTGYLSQDNNELAKYCINLLNNQDLYNELSHQSRERAISLMDIKKYKKVLMQIYNENIN